MGGVHVWHQVAAGDAADSSEPQSGDLNPLVSAGAHIRAGANVIPFRVKQHADGHYSLDESDMRSSTSSRDALSPRSCESDATEKGPTEKSTAGTATAQLSE